MLIDDNMTGVWLKRICVYGGLLSAVVLVVFYRQSLVSLISPSSGRTATNKTVADRLAEFGDAARSRMRPSFERAGVSYPPRQLALIGLKAERVVQIYAADAGGNSRLVCVYPILAASGESGPKLREGDRQVPEGIYPIESLNPNSDFHVSLRVGYPNEFDRRQAKAEGRKKLGGDIMIHGGAASIGCIAVGDEAAEEFFVLAADVGVENIAVILSPVDFRVGKAVPPDANLPEWCASLYGAIRTRLKDYPKESAP